MILFADDIRARAGCNGITTLFSHVVMALQPCDRVLILCDKLKIEQYTWKWTESGVCNNTAVFYNKDLLGIYIYLCGFLRYVKTSSIFVVVKMSEDQHEL